MSCGKNLICIRLVILIKTLYSLVLPFTAEGDLHKSKGKHDPEAFSFAKQVRWVSSGGATWRQTLPHQQVVAGGWELCRWRIIGGRRGGSQHPGKLDHHLRSPHLTPTWTTGKGVVGEPKLEKGWIIRTAVTASAGGTMHKGESATEGRSLRPKQCRPPTKGRANRGKEKTMWRQMTSSRCEMVCGTRWWPPAGVERPPLRTK